MRKKSKNFLKQDSSKFSLNSIPYPMDHMPVLLNGLFSFVKNILSVANHVFSPVIYMKYSVNQRRISRFVKIVNFVRQARAKDQICLMAVIAALFTIVIVLWSSAFSRAIAQDMRQNSMEFERKIKLFQAKAAQELKDAKMAAEKQEKFIKQHHNALIAAINALKTKNKIMKKTNVKLQANIDEISKKEKQAKKELSAPLDLNMELSGFILENAKQLKTIINTSLESALHQNPHDFVLQLINQKKFFSMKDITMMTDILFKEIILSGEVRKTKGMIIDRKGREKKADLLILGNFTGIYSLHNETGFLLYSKKSHRLFALSRLPDSNIKDNLNAYIRGKTSDVYMDISKGAALRHLTHKLNLWAQIPKGGPIVWPIIAILGLAVLIILERLIFFLRKTMDTDVFMCRLEPFVLQHKWDECRSMLSLKKNKLVPDVLLTALEFKDQERVDMENALQEAILRKIPGIEKFLSTLGMLAAIAPLLGLLGTVTGMINTFHVITYYGTGDPKMMASGISEALVTTMLGLAVAIPIMLVHTLLNRKVETEISKMEEKAVSFVNMVFKSRKNQSESQDSQPVWIFQGLLQVRPLPEQERIFSLVLQRTTPFI